MEEELASVLVLPYSQMDRKQFFGFSGMLISDRWVLTHSIVFERALAKISDAQEFLNNSEYGKLVSIPEPIRETLAFRIYRTVDQSTHPVRHCNKCTTGDVISSYQKKVHEEIGHGAFLWKCRRLKETLESFFLSLSYTDDSNLTAMILPTSFILIKLQRSEPIVTSEIFDAVSALLRLEERAWKKPIRGQTIEIRSTPFGKRAFLNSISRGIISNVIDRDMLMVDSSLFPHCEGGPVFVVKDCGCKSICGIVILPMGFLQGQVVYYSFAANLFSCLQEIEQKWKPINDILYKEEHKEDRSVVIVRCGASWGTGIFLDRQSGTFLTCSHVVPNNFEVSLEMCTDDFHWEQPATLVYKTPDNIAYDIAVLRVDPEKLDPSMRPLTLAQDYAVEGERVYSLGFPFSTTLHPTVNNGVVSKSLDYMLQSTCFTQTGSSGGPIIMASSGEVLGMIVSNSIIKESSKAFPDLNMAIPSVVMKKPLEEYIRTGNASVLNVLTVDDVAVQNTWGQGAFLRSKM